MRDGKGSVQARARNRPAVALSLSAPPEAEEPVSDPGARHQARSTSPPTHRHCLRLLRERRSAGGALSSFSLSIPSLSILSHRRERLVVGPGNNLGLLHEGRQGIQDVGGDGLGGGAAVWTGRERRKVRVPECGNVVFGDASADVGEEERGKGRACGPPDPLRMLPG